MKYVIFFIFFIISVLINNYIIDDTYYFITPFFMFDVDTYKLISIIILFFVEIAIFIMHAECITKKLLFILFINYFAYICFNFFSFVVVSPFLLLTVKIIQFIFSLYLNEELYIQNKTSAKILTPYVIWSFYLSLVSISIFFLNNS